MHLVSLQGDVDWSIPTPKRNVPIPLSLSITAASSSSSVSTHTPMPQAQGDVQMPLDVRFLTLLFIQLTLFDVSFILSLLTSVAANF